MARHDDDDDDPAPFDRRGILRDGRSTRVPMAMRDSASDHRQFDAALHRPGFRGGSSTTDAAVLVTVADAREKTYDAYEREMSQAWRGADASGQPEGAICTVREGGGRYGPEGAPGHMRRVDGVLACVADDWRDDSRRDSQTTMDAEYAAYDARMTQAWRTPS